MSMEHDTDLQALRDAVDRVLREQAAPGADGAANDRLWAALAQIGVLGLRIPEEFGGIGAGAAETVVVMEAMGRAHVGVPYLGTSVVAATLIAGAGNRPQQEAWLPAIARGERRIALANSEPGARFDPSDVSTTARRTPEGGWVLDGIKSPVADSAGADAYLVPARSSGQRFDEQGITMFIVPADAPGLRQLEAATFDGRVAARLELRGCRIPDAAVLGMPDAGAGLLDDAAQAACLALCAESVGAMQAMFEHTLEHLRTRRQFDAVLGSFQALQHRAVDMLVALEQARSIVWHAASVTASGTASDRAGATAAAKALVGRNARFVGQQAVQLHGGMGMTEECPVGRHFRRVTANDLLYGDEGHHIQWLVARGGFQPSEMGVHS